MEMRGKATATLWKGTLAFDQPETGSSFRKVLVQNSLQLLDLFRLFFWTGSF